MPISSEEYKDLTLDDVFALCPSGLVTGAKRAQLTALVGKDELVGRSALKIWIVDFLLKELPDKGPGIMLWADWLAKATDVIGDMWSRIVGDGAGPGPRLAIGGGRFVVRDATLGGMSPDRSKYGLFDLVEGDWVAPRVDSCFETRIFNLRLLFRSCLERRKQWTNKRPGFGEIRKAPQSVS